MFELRKIIGAFLLSIIVLSSAGFALYVEKGDKIYISHDRSIDDNLLVTGNTINVAGNVKGDLIAIGKKIVVSGTIEGNVIAAGLDVLIPGSAKNIFTAGRVVSIDGIAKKDLIVGGLEFFMGKDARIGKDAFLGCGSAYLSGKIYRDLRVISRLTVVNPTVMVKGNLGYTSQNVNISNEATISGMITSYTSPTYLEKLAKTLLILVIIQKIIGSLSVLLLGILAVIYFPNQVKEVTARMTGDFWNNFGLGIVYLILIPITFIILSATIIGIPLGLLLLVLYFLGIYISPIFSGIVIGKWIFNNMGKPAVSLIWALIIGLVIFFLAGIAPFIGWVVRLIFFLWVFGALISSRFGFRKKIENI
jgi:hypothetical protein